MKICVLGTNGFLSSAIGRYANRKKWELCMYGLSSPTSHAYETYFEINLKDTELDCSHLVDYDIIIYAIGAGIQANLNEDCNLIYRLNVAVPVEICNNLRALDYKGCFVTFGSYFEMGETLIDRPFTEAEVLSSISPAPNDYSVSKRMISKYVSSYNHGFTHWHFIIPTIYGAGENPKRLIPYVVNAIRNNEELHFTAGDQIRQYIHIDEIPRIIELSFINKLSSGIYNISGLETLSVKEIVTLVHEIMGKKVPENCFGTVERADVGMKYLALDGSRLWEEIGFKPTISITDTLMTY